MMLALKKVGFTEVLHQLAPSVLVLGRDLIFFHSQSHLQKIVCLISASDGVSMPIRFF